jgi:hypothetical protein
LLRFSLYLEYCVAFGDVSEDWTWVQVAACFLTGFKADLTNVDGADATGVEQRLEERSALDGLLAHENLFDDRRLFSVS